MSTPETPPSSMPQIDLRLPTIDDGAMLWALARDTEVLDLNSPYAYLLWCRDFSATSVVAGADRPVGFITGYRRPDEPNPVRVAGGRR